MNSEEVFCRVGKIWKKYLVVDYWIGEIKMTGFILEAILYDFLIVADESWGCCWLCKPK